MKLIGYGLEEYVRSPNDGLVKAATKTINLNTGEYEINGGTKKKVNIDVITLSNIEKYFYFLSPVRAN